MPKTCKTVCSKSAHYLDNDQLERDLLCFYQSRDADLLNTILSTHIHELTRHLVITSGYRLEWADVIEEMLVLCWKLIDKQAWQPARGKAFSYFTHCCQSALAYAYRRELRELKNINGLLRREWLRSGYMGGTLNDHKQTFLGWEEDPTLWERRTEGVEYWRTISTHLS